MSLSRRNSNAIQSSSSRRRSWTARNLAVGAASSAVRQAARYAWNNRGGIARAVRSFGSIRRSAAGGRGLRGTNANRIQQGTVVNEGVGGQCSYFNGGTNKSYLPKHVEDFLPPQVVQVATASQLKTAAASQNVLTTLTLWSPALATTYTGDKISRVLYDEASGDVTFNNIYLSNCHLTIYDIMARKDLSSGSAVGSPSAAWTQGDVDIGVSGAYDYVGSTPWQSEAFNQFFKVKQVTEVVLGAGGTHVHKVRMKPRKTVSAAYAQYSGAQFAGLTYYCLIKIQGSPANDTVTQSQVSLGEAGLNIVVQSEHHLKQLQKSTPTISVTSSLTSFSNAEQTVNVGGSTIVSNAEG